MEGIGLKTTQFQERVYAWLVENVPEGKVTTYGTIARALDSSPRAVGQAMRCNPYAPKVPCHRVVSDDGSIGGFNGVLAGEPINRKLKLLKNEGVKFSGAKVLSDCIIK